MRLSLNIMAVVVVFLITGVGMIGCNSESPIKEDVVTCLDGERLSEGVCVSIITTSCSDGETLTEGVCIPITTCLEGETFTEGKCVPTTPTCPAGQTLLEGECVSTNTTCPEGETFSDGECVPTAPTCTPDEQAVVNGQSYCYDYVITFEDSVLGKIVRESLNLDDDKPLTVRLALGMTELNVNPNGSEKISSLKGIEFLKNLEQLAFYNSRIKDISPLKDLQKLWGLGLNGENRVNDFSVLGQLVQLSTLNIVNSEIDNGKLKKIATALKDSQNFVNLFLRSASQIDDFSSLSLLTRLKSVAFDSSEINGVRLESLVRILRDLPEFTLLSLSGNKDLTNFGTLARLRELKGFYYSSAKVDDVELESLINVLKDLPNLNLLDLSSNKDITNFISLGRLTRLRMLSLRYNEIDNDKLGKLVWAVKDLPELFYLDLSGNNLITNFNPLNYLTHLKTLNFNYAEINNTKLENLVNILKSSTTLFNLDLYSNNITKISILEKFIGSSLIKEIDLRGNSSICNPSNYGTISRLTNAGIKIYTDCSIPSSTQSNF